MYLGKCTPAVLWSWTIAKVPIRVSDLVPFEVLETAHIYHLQGMRGRGAMAQPNTLRSMVRATWAVSCEVCGVSRMDACATPLFGAAIGGLCITVGPRAQARISDACACLQGIPALVCHCLCMPNHHVFMWHWGHRGTPTLQTPSLCLPEGQQ